MLVCATNTLLPKSPVPYARKKKCLYVTKWYQPLVFTICAVNELVVMPSCSSVTKCIVLLNETFRLTAALDSNVTLKFYFLVLY